MITTVYNKDLDEYRIYRKVFEELARPLDVSGLDIETIIKLYKSKLIYLENLRLRCFNHINHRVPSGSVSCFNGHDLSFIIYAQKETKLHLRQVYLSGIRHHLAA